MRAYDRDLIRGGHYGQRSCEPHSKAEHMAAPTQTCHVRFSLPTRSRPHMALSVGSLRRTDLVAVGGIADFRRSLAARRTDANDPRRSQDVSNTALQQSPVAS